MSDKTESSSAPSLVLDKPYTQTRGLDPSALASSEECELRKRWREQVPELWDQLTNDLLRIRNVERDWDGLGAEAPDAALVDYAIDLLKKLRRADELRPLTRIVATPAGTVLFEWQCDDGYVEAEIVRPDRAEWMLERPGERPVHWMTS
jgi:hypothetical protein